MGVAGILLWYEHIQIPVRAAEASPLGANWFAGNDSGGVLTGPLMNFIGNLLTALVAALHIYFLVLEMFLWQKPQGLKTFRNTPEKAEITAVLAANQGLYNGFLAAGLIWGLLHSGARLRDSRSRRSFCSA